MKEWAWETGGLARVGGGGAGTGVGVGVGVGREEAEGGSAWREGETPRTCTFNQTSIYNSYRAHAVVREPNIHDMYMYM